MGFSTIHDLGHLLRFWSMSPKDKGGCHINEFKRQMTPSEMLIGEGNEVSGKQKVPLGCLSP